MDIQKNFSKNPDGGRVWMEGDIEVARGRRGNYAMFVIKVPEYYDGVDNGYLAISLDLSEVMRIIRNLQHIVDNPAGIGVGR